VAVAPSAELAAFCGFTGWIIGHAEPYRQLLSSPDAARAASEAEAAATATAFHLHVVWPQAGALYLIVEGDGEPAELGGLLAERLDDGAWTPSWMTVPGAEESPAELDAGQRSDWVVESGVEPELRRCEACQRVGVPPHRPGCAFEQRDDEHHVTQARNAGRLGPTVGLDEEDDRPIQVDEVQERELAGA
jgi:hypothetical protein